MLHERAVRKPRRFWNDRNDDSLESQTSHYGVPPAPSRDFSPAGWHRPNEGPSSQYGSSNRSPRQDSRDNPAEHVDGFGEAARSLLERRKADEQRRRSQEDLSGRGNEDGSRILRNPDGSVTAPRGTKVVVKFGYARVGAKASDDYVFRTLGKGEIGLPARVTLRKVGADLDNERGLVRVYKVEPHPGDDVSTKERLLQLLEGVFPHQFDGLPNAPVRAIRVEISTPGYKKVKGAERVLASLPQRVVKTDTLTRKAPVRQPARPVSRERTVAPVNRSLGRADTGYGQRPFAPRDVPAPQRPSALRGASVWDNSRDAARMPVAAPVRPVQPFSAFPSRIAFTDLSDAPFAPAPTDARPAAAERPAPRVNFDTDARSLESNLEGLRLLAGTTVDVRVSYRVPGGQTQHILDAITLGREIEVDGSASGRRFIGFSLSSPELRHVQHLGWKGERERDRAIAIGNALARHFIEDKLYLLPITVGSDSVINVQFYPFGTKTRR